MEIFAQVSLSKGVINDGSIAMRAGRQSSQSVCHIPLGWALVKEKSFSQSSKVQQKYSRTTCSLQISVLLWMKLRTSLIKERQTYFSIINLDRRLFIPLWQIKYAKLLLHLMKSPYTLPTLKYTDLHFKRNMSSN